MDIFLDYKKKYDKDYIIFNTLIRNIGISSYLK